MDHETYRRVCKSPNLPKIIYIWIGFQGLSHWHEELHIIGN